MFRSHFTKRNGKTVFFNSILFLLLCSQLGNSALFYDLMMVITEAESEEKFNILQVYLESEGTL